MNYSPDKKKRCNKRVRVLSSGEGNIMEKFLHREVEKQRRQEMASLYASLRSLLPLHFIQGRRSTSDQLNEAVNYINYLQRNIKDLSSKRDDLMLLSRQSFGSSNEEGRRCTISDDVVVRPCLAGVEIVIRLLKTPLSSVLQVILDHGLCVLSCISSSVNDRLIYTIQAEVSNLALFELEDLKGTLTLMK